MDRGLSRARSEQATFRQIGRLSGLDPFAVPIAFWFLRLSRLRQSPSRARHEARDYRAVICRGSEPLVASRCTGITHESWRP